MKFSFKFSNLLGSVYRHGNLLFTPDGSSVISPVGNRVTRFDLKNNKSATLATESALNITAMALSPDGNLLITVNEEGDADLISLINNSVISTYKFHRKVHAICFSPNGKKFAATKDNNVMVFHAPGRTKEFNPFVLYRIYMGAGQATTCIDWSSDSQVFLVGGEDMNTRVHAVENLENLGTYSVGGHNDCIVNAFFEKKSLNFYSIDRSGRLIIWECSDELDDLVSKGHYVNAKSTDKNSDSESDDDDNRTEVQKVMQKKIETEKRNKITYRQKTRFTYKESRGDTVARAHVSCVTFHKTTRIMCTGFSDGAFYLHEMPDFNLIHSLSISENLITTALFNNQGDWLALGSSELGQLLVWEWQSETYVLKQQGHFNNMRCVSYSPDGQYLATGAEDAKVKLWNTTSGFCFVTFNEHLSAVTGVVFNHNGQVVISASLDGTVRAFDLNRYRNFRTLTTPHPAQFASLAIDHSGEIICAGAQDTYEIFVWSMQTGRLLEILTGHEAPVHSLTFDSNKAVLCSGSWDKTMKLWDVFESKNTKESFDFTSDVICVCYRPDGKEVAVSTLNAQISFWDMETSSQTGAIEGRHDLGLSLKDQDKVSAKKLSFGRAFNSLCYTADGKCILAGGISKFVCIYSVAEQMLVKKFEITCNRSLDGVMEFVDRRKMTEWGSLSLVEEAEDPRFSQTINLPGVRTGNLSDRHFKPQVRVTGLKFSPTGRAFAATTTEGLLIFSLDQNLIFDPFQLDIDITPRNIRRVLKKCDYSTAIMMAFRLNEQSLIQEVVENVPENGIKPVVHNLPAIYIDKLLGFVSTQIESSLHLHFYLLWAKHIMSTHGPQLKQRSMEIMSTLRTLQKGLTIKLRDIGSVCDHNTYTLEYQKSLAVNKRKHTSPLDVTSSTEMDVPGDVEGSGVASEVDSDDEAGYTHQDGAVTFIDNFSDSDDGDNVATLY